MIHPSADDLWDKYCDLSKYSSSLMDNEVYLDLVWLLQAQMHNSLNLSYNAQILQMKVAVYFDKLDRARVPESNESF